MRNGGMQRRERGEGHGREVLVFGVRAERKPVKNEGMRKEVVKGKEKREGKGAEREGKRVDKGD